MGLFEFYCPITGEKVRIRAEHGAQVQPFYSAGASKEAIDKWEAETVEYFKKLQDGKELPRDQWPVQWQRHPHQK